MDFELILFLAVGFLVAQKGATAKMKKKSSIMLGADKPDQSDAEYARLKRSRPDANNSINEEMAQIYGVGPPQIAQGEYDQYYSVVDPDGALRNLSDPKNMPTQFYDDDLALNF